MQIRQFLDPCIGQRQRPGKEDRESHQQRQESSVFPTHFLDGREDDFPDPGALTPGCFLRASVFSVSLASTTTIEVNHALEREMARPAGQRLDIPALIAHQSGMDERQQHRRTGMGSPQWGMPHIGEVSTEDQEESHYG